MKFETLSTQFFLLPLFCVSHQGNSLQTLPNFPGNLFFILHGPSLQFMGCMSAPKLVSASWKSPTRHRCTGGAPTTQTPTSRLCNVCLPLLCPPFTSCNPPPSPPFHLRQWKSCNLHSLHILGELSSSFLIRKVLKI